jgi:hypothetical protein
MLFFSLDGWMLFQLYKSLYPITLFLFDLIGLNFYCSQAFYVSFRKSSRNRVIFISNLHFIIWRYDQFPGI